MARMITANRFSAKPLPSIKGYRIIINARETRR
jgi:hypothetical protein